MAKVGNLDASLWPRFHNRGHTRQARSGKSCVCWPRDAMRCRLLVLLAADVACRASPEGELQPRTLARHSTSALDDLLGSASSLYSNAETWQQQRQEQQQQQQQPESKAYPPSSSSPRAQESPAQESSANQSPAKSSFAAEFADKLANGGMLEPQFTCAAASIADTAPSLASDPLGGMLPPKGWPAKDAKWLFYGPSYMGQLYQAAVAAATFVTAITSVTDISSAYNVLECPNSSATATSMAGACNWEGAHDTACHGAPAARARATRVTFANGAELWGVSNAPVFQWESRPDAMAALDDLVARHAFELVFYMAPHDTQYFEMHCAHDAEHRPLDGRQDDDDMCLPKVPNEMRGRVGGSGGYVAVGGWPTNPVTIEQHLACVRNRPSFRTLERYAKQRAAKLVHVLPWQVNPQGQAAGEGVYLSFPAAWRYPCTGVGHNGLAGVAVGPCAGGAFKRGPALADFREGHPCTVLCERGSGRCVLGAAALMAMEMVGAALGGTPLHDDSLYSDWQPRIATMCADPDL